MNYSNRVSAMQASPIRKLVPFAQAAKDKGIKVYHLNIGQPDIKTPKGFFDAVKNFDSEVLEYATSEGIPELLEALQNYYKTYDMNFEKDELLVTNGGSEALLFTMMAVCDPGDNLLVPEPFYTNYNGFGQSVNVEVNAVTTKAENGFHLPSKEEILSKVDDKTKAIILSNPGNPTGAIYTKEELNILAEIAKEKNIPICQDTGMAVFFVEIGQEVLIEGDTLTDAINEGVRQGYEEGYLRKSVVSPINRVNTKDNTPAVIHYDMVKGDKIKIEFAAKGFGSENMSKMKMLKPSDGLEGIKKFIIDTVSEAGPNPCPPMVIGVGIGGTVDKCAQIAKKALFRELGEFNKDENIAKLESELLTAINKLGIGPQGLGGTTTALGLNIETFPTHIAGLPVVVNINCHASRHKKVVI